jgi:hypothetical protein
VVTRRSFLTMAGSLLLKQGMLPAPAQETPAIPPLEDQVPPMLDHILLGSSDLERGIAFVEAHTGVRAAFGGVHPGRGTQNALLSLGERRYLEVIAPDPRQPHGNALAAKLETLAEPRLVGWAAHPRNLEALAAELQRAGIVAEGPTPGSRKRPDGQVLHWQTLNLRDDASGLLPFFIEWGAGSPHPSSDAPAGCQLIRLELLTPDPARLAKLAAHMSLEVPIAKAAAPELHAVIEGPKLTLSITS